MGHSLPQFAPQGHATHLTFRRSNCDCDCLRVAFQVVCNIIHSSCQSSQGSASSIFSDGDVSPVRIARTGNWYPELENLRYTTFRFPFGPFV